MMKYEGTQKKGQIIVVLGMHRGGTSAITRALKALGVSLGDNIYEAKSDNPKGFWEDCDCLQVNEALLRHLHSDHIRFSVAWTFAQLDPVISDLRVRATETLMRGLQKGDGLWGFKDPRTARLMGFWRPVLEQAGNAVSFVIAVRHPLSVARSLERRNQVPAEKAYLLWLQHMVPAVLETAGAPRRVVVDYDQMMDHPREQLCRMAEGLGLGLRASEAVISDYVDDFLEESLRHTRFSVADLAQDSRAPEIVVKSYQLLLDATGRNCTLDSPELLAHFREAALFLHTVQPVLAYANLIEDERDTLLKTVATQVEQFSGTAQQLAAERCRAETAEQQLAIQRGWGNAVQQQLEAERNRAEMAAQKAASQLELSMSVERHLAVERAGVQAARQQLAVLQGWLEAAREQVAAERNRAESAEQQLAAARKSGEAAREQVAAERNRAESAEQQLAAARKSGEAAREQADLAQAEALRLKVEVQQLGQQLSDSITRMGVIESSTGWRLLAPVRTSLHAYPGLRRALRRMVKLVWWSVTLQLPRRLRGRSCSLQPETTPKSSQDTTPIVSIPLLESWVIANHNQPAGLRQPVLSAPLLVRYFLGLGFTQNGADAWVSLLRSGQAQPSRQESLNQLLSSVHDLGHFRTLLEHVRASPFFNLDFYRGVAGFEGTDQDAATHYLLLGEPLGLAPSAYFNPEYYRKRHPDLTEAGLNNLVHYTDKGRDEGRPGLPSGGYYANSAPTNLARENVIVVVHETSRTGAPILAWNIAAQLAQKYNLYTIILAGGPLTPEFEALSVEVYGPYSGVHSHPVDLEFGLRPLFDCRVFKYAVVNSSESRNLVEIFYRRNIISVLMIHEFGSYVRPLDTLTRAFDLASEVVFPTQLVADSSVNIHPALHLRTLHIEPQGMSIVPGGNVTKKLPSPEKMEILRTARDAGAFVVLGAGSVNLRKGVDMFIAVAAAVLRFGRERPVHFLWVGGGYNPCEDMGYSIYLEEQIIRSGLENHITFMDELSELESVYALADVFLLSSRLDPLPNVSIDAVCRGIPTICFKDASGMADLMLKDSEMADGVVPHLDAGAAAALINKLAADEPGRLRMADATMAFGRRVFDMARYVERLDALASASLNKRLSGHGQ
jgi:glycosyltransferase involved in cell wall biosynthesis